jgi:2-phosphosulfolactate phosphatase
MNIIPKVEVCLSPQLLNLYDISDKVVVVIDVLRATSTICTALHYGVNSVIPVSSVKDCLNYKDTPDHILAAERDAETPYGFEYSNSPRNYMNDAIKGKTLVLTTTNGTKLLHEVIQAKEIVIGAFVNIAALSNYLLSQDKDVLLACAAWKGRVNMEDSLFAGGVISHIKSKFNIFCDSGKMLTDLYDQIQPDLYNYHLNASHHQRLVNLGAAEDFKYCFQENIAPVVPVLIGNKLVNHSAS